MIREVMKFEDYWLVLEKEKVGDNSFTSKVLYSTEYRDKAETFLKSYNAEMDRRKNNKQLQAFENLSEAMQTCKFQIKSCECFEVDTFIYFNFDKKKFAIHEPEYDVEDYFSDLETAITEFLKLTDH